MFVSSDSGERNAFPAPPWASKVSPGRAQPAYFDAIAVAESSGTPDGEAMANLMKILMGMDDATAITPLHRLCERADEAATASPFGRIRNSVAISNAIEVINLYGLHALRPHLKSIGFDQDGNIAEQCGVDVDALPERRERRGPAAKPEENAEAFEYARKEAIGAVTRMSKAFLGIERKLAFQAAAKASSALSCAETAADAEKALDTLHADLAKVVREDWTLATVVEEATEGLSTMIAGFGSMAEGIDENWPASWMRSAAEQVGAAMADEAEAPTEPDAAKEQPQHQKSESSGNAKAKGKPKTGAEGEIAALIEEVGPLSGRRLDNLTRGEPRPREFVLKPHFPLGTVGILFGPGGVGKSLVGLDLGLGVSRLALMAAGSTGNISFNAGPLGGHIPPEAAGAVLFVTGEDDVDDINRRIRSLDPNNQREGAPFYVFTLANMPRVPPELVRKERFVVSTTTWLSLIERYVKQIKEDCGHPVKLLILDPAGDLIGGDENDSEIVKFLQRKLTLFAAKYRMSILLIGHVGKGDEEEAVRRGMRGSSAWVLNSRAAYGIWRATPGQAKAVLAKLGRETGDVVFGQLIKSNHPEANHSKMTFVREADGRLVDITALTRGARQDDALDLLVGAIGEAASDGRPFALSGDNGLHARRDELPSPLNQMSRNRLERVAEQAITMGLLIKSGKRGAGGGVTLVPVNGDPKREEEQ
jgi:hypothetical protein